MKKKILSLIIAVVLAASLFGCGNTTAGSAKNNEDIKTEDNKAKENASQENKQEDFQANSQESEQLNSHDSEQMNSQDIDQVNSQEDSQGNEINEGDAFNNRIEMYQGVSSTTKSWEIEIDYQQDYTLVTITHNTQIFATYEAGKKPTGEPREISVYDLGGSSEPVLSPDDVKVMLEWSGDNLLLYKSDLSHFTPSDENPWELEGMEFKKYNEVVY